MLIIEEEEYSTELTYCTSRPKTDISIMQWQVRKALYGHVISLTILNL